jgi:hypothetical protein
MKNRVPKRELGAKNMPDSVQLLPRLSPLYLAAGLSFPRKQSLCFASQKKKLNSAIKTQARFERGQGALDGGYLGWCS